MLRFKLVMWVILYSIKIGTNPWRYFQLNAPWFNQEKGIFSKLETDQQIPSAWRLPQQALTKDYQPASFPVFLKPEWGQNSYGIKRIDDLQSWSSALSDIDYDLSYIVQTAATGKCEYEIFYIRNASELEQHSMFSISKAHNQGNSDYPINSIRNQDTVYTDCTDEFDAAAQTQLWQMLGAIGDYKIARVCCRCDNAAALVAGEFQIIEINLFVPMPLILMDSGISKRNKDRFLRQMGNNLASLIKIIPEDQPGKSIFFRKWALHRRMLK